MSARGERRPEETGERFVTVTEHHGRTGRERGGRGYGVAEVQSWKSTAAREVQWWKLGVRTAVVTVPTIRLEHQENRAPARRKTCDLVVAPLQAV